LLGLSAFAFAAEGVKVKTLTQWCYAGFCNYLRQHCFDFCGFVIVDFAAFWAYDVDVWGIVGVVS